MDYTLIECTNDLPDGVVFKNGKVAVDSETDGLDVRSVNLWLAQLCDGEGNVWLVKFDGTDYSAPNLRRVLEDDNILKLFHFGRFDLAILQRALNIPEVKPAFCTKIASKLLRKDTARHNLRTLVQDYLDVTLDKTEQLSDWSVPVLSDSQKAYAASDVLYLHGLHEKMTTELTDKGMQELMVDALRFLPARVRMDLEGYPEGDLFAHK
ncbi:MAG: ribonuclease D [Alphaproteobacteria bacterium CG_4_10_14_0_8_um_filter_53_9]|nr:MAG: ribonuclease D [Alphaproteobacteria bacterium CG_4_10_14_0_8_um_filter_53_9]